MSYPKIIGWCYMANPIKNTSNWHTNDWIFEPLQPNSFPDSILVDTWSEADVGNSHALYAYDGKNHNSTYHDTWIRIQLDENDFYGLVSDLTIEFGARTSNSLDYIITAVNNQSDFFPKNENGQSLYKTSYPPQIDNYNSQTKKYDMWMIDTSGNRISVNDKILSQAKVERIGTTNRLKVVLPPFKATSNIIDLNLKCLGLGVYYDDTTYNSRERWVLTADIKSECTITYKDINNTEIEKYKASISYGDSITIQPYPNNIENKHFLCWIDSNGNEYKAGIKIESITQDLELSPKVVDQINNLQEVLWHDEQKQNEFNSPQHFEYERIASQQESRDYLIPGDEIIIKPNLGYYTNQTTYTIVEKNNTINIYANKYTIVYNIPDNENTESEIVFHSDSIKINGPSETFETEYKCHLDSNNNTTDTEFEFSKDKDWITEESPWISIIDNNVSGLETLLNSELGNKYTINVWPLFKVEVSTDYQIITISTDDNYQFTNFFESSDYIKKFAANKYDANKSYIVKIEMVSPYTIIVDNAECKYYPDRYDPTLEDPITAGYYSFCENGCFAQLYINESEEKYLKLLPKDGEILHIYSVKPNKTIWFKAPNNNYIKLN